MSNSFKLFCAKKVEEWSNKVNALLPGKEAYDDVYDELSTYGSWQSTDLGIDKLEPANEAYNDAVAICDKWEIISQSIDEYPVVLNFAGLGLEMFPVEICELESLTSLDLSGNQIPSLPNEIGKLTNLIELNLSNNEISNLPAEFGQLVKLERLDLSYNPLPNLPPEIERLTNLKTLKL